jgi:CheY-like chemotaxis protein
LVVEDDVLLETFGFDVHAVATGAEAVTAVEICGPASSLWT